MCYKKFNNLGDRSGEGQSAKAADIVVQEIRDMGKLVLFILLI